MTKRGRPAISTFCVDCFREGKVPPEAQPKQINSSYCSNHNKIRQNKSHFNRSQRKAVIHGAWSKIPADAQPTLVENCRKNIERAYELNKAYGDPVQVALNEPYAATIAFEWSCVELAIQLGRRITMAEEDEVISTFSGSRTGTDALDTSKNAASRIEAASGSVLLPNPKIRQKFRAQDAGPTTEGEPSFTTYYERQVGQEPPADLKEEVDPNELVQASNGIMVPRNMLKGYEFGIKHGMSAVGKDDPIRELYAGDPNDVVDDPRTPGAIVLRKNLPGYDAGEAQEYFDRMKDIP
jgi:hypothetical protein